MLTLSASLAFLCKAEQTCPGLALAVFDKDRTKFLKTVVFSFSKNMKIWSVFAWNSCTFDKIQWEWSLNNSGNNELVTVHRKVSNSPRKRIRGGKSWKHEIIILVGHREAIQESSGEHWSTFLSRWPRAVYRSQTP